MIQHSVWKGAVLAAALAVAQLVGAGTAVADTYPARPLKMIVPFTPGGPTDALARIFANELQKQLDQTVVVENKPGAAGNLGAAIVARAEPDGYTLLFASSGPMLINASLFKDPGFDARTDFTPIAYIGEIPNVLVVNSATKENDLPSFFKSIKGRSDISYGSSGNGSTNHLIAEKLRHDLDEKWVHVPYKGTAPALTDLMGGQTSFMFVDVLTAASQIKGGRIKALGIASSERSPVMPDVETFDEQGIPSLNRGVAFGVSAPAGLTMHEKDVLAAAAREAIDSPSMQAYMKLQGVQPGSIKTPEAFAYYIDEQIVSWGKVVQLANIEPN
jgi:tripartite-type tricarboxylate transporter receptor subunit TctC